MSGTGTLQTRAITVQFKLGQGNFGQSGFDTLTVEGARVIAQIDRAALPFMAEASMQIYGLQQTVMNQLSTLGGAPILTGRLNEVTISAGDPQNGMTQIFQGIIQNGWQDYSGAPSAAFALQGTSGGLDLLKPANPNSYTGTADVATILSQLCAKMTPPLTLNNNGVNVKLTTPYLTGTLIDQIRVVISAANINGEIHNGSLYIWPRNAKRPVAATTLSPSSGLYGYPSFNGAEMVGLRCLFTPTIDYGSEIIVQSSITPACGSWYVAQMSHTLASQTPGGPWFTDMTVMSLDYFLGQPSN
jgi:hypothetical protein